MIPARCIHAFHDGKVPRYRVQGLFSLCRRIGVDPVDYAPDPRRQGEIGENFHNTALIGEGRLLEHGQILELRLGPDLRDIGHAGDGADFFHQVLSGTRIGRSRRIGQFNAVHQPRPIICQNLALLMTFLKNTRLSTSGTSMPASSMSTEMTIWGSAPFSSVKVTSYSARSSSDRMEDIPIFMIDGAVGLVADDQVEVAHGEQLSLPVLHQVDAVHHGLVGGKDAVGGVLQCGYEERTNAGQKLREEHHA